MATNDPALFVHTVEAACAALTFLLSALGAFTAAYRGALKAHIEAAKWRSAVEGRLGDHDKAIDRIEAGLKANSEAITLHCDEDRKGFLDVQKQITALGRRIPKMPRRQKTQGDTG